MEDIADPQAVYKDSLCVDMLYPTEFIRLRLVQKDEFSSQPEANPPEKTFPQRTFSRVEKGIVDDEPYSVSESVQWQPRDSERLCDYPVGIDP